MAQDAVLLATWKQCHLIASSQISGYSCDTSHPFPRHVIEIPGHTSVFV